MIVVIANLESIPVLAAHVKSTQARTPLAFLDGGWALLIDFWKLMAEERIRLRDYNEVSDPAVIPASVLLVVQYPVGVTLEQAVGEAQHYIGVLRQPSLLSEEPTDKPFPPEIEGLLCDLLCGAKRLHPLSLP
jgi:hypothetical protein